MPTNCYRTNAAIICPSQVELEECMLKKEFPPTRCLFISDETQLCRVLEGASKTGEWIVCDADVISSETLRLAVHRVWLHAQWDHHEDFRFWVIDGGLRKKVIARGGRTEEMLPFILTRSAIDLRYTSAFLDEFDARELVSAVEDSYLAGVYRNNIFVSRLQPSDVVALFRKAVKEEILLALMENEDGTASTCIRYIVDARSMEGFSPLDVAIEKDFRTAAARLRDYGCKSEEFDFERLLDPSFQPMLNRLLDPWKPFPFDAKSSCSCLARAKRHQILKKLFDCRVDVNFEGSDYPLAEACFTGDESLILLVLDRMGATGVNPLQDGRLCLYFVNKILTVDYSVTPEVVNGEQLLTTPIPSVVAPLLLKLCDVIIDEGQRVFIMLNALKRAVEVEYSASGLTRRLLRCIDVTQVADVEQLLNFFIDFDPENELGGEVTKLGMEQTAASAGTAVDRKMFEFIERMIRLGERTISMTRAALRLAIQRDYVPMTYRKSGETLLMVCTRVPPNKAAFEAILQVVSANGRGNVINQTDLSGNNCLKRLVVHLCQLPLDHGPYLDTFGDMVEILLSLDSEWQVEPPAFSANLFTLCSRADLGEICYELLPVRKADPCVGSIILSTTSNLLALMFNRHLRKYQQDRRRRVGEFRKRLKDRHFRAISGSDEEVEQERRTISELLPLAAFAQSENPIDIRVNPKPRLDAGETIRTVATDLDLLTIAHIVSYLPLNELPALRRSCVTLYVATLSDHALLQRVKDSSQVTYLQCSSEALRKEPK